MSKIFTLAEELIKEYREATSGLTIANATLNDINHEAEFAKGLTAKQKAEAYDKWVEVMRDRRVHKDTLENLSRIFGDMEYVVQKFGRQKEFMENRVYTKRVEEEEIGDLFG